MMESLVRRHPSPCPLPQGKGVKKEFRAGPSLAREVWEEKSRPLPLREGVGGGVIVGRCVADIGEAAR
jgi:hypothetical protein